MLTCNQVFKFFLLVGYLCLSTPSSTPSDSMVFNIDTSQMKSFQEDGYLIVRQLIRGDDLKKAQKDAKKLLKKKSPFDALKKVGRHSYAKVTFNDLMSSPALRTVALRSDCPKVVGQLMKEPEIRVLKDAALAFGLDSTGW